MIELTFAELAFWVLGLTLIVILVGAWSARWSNAKEERRSIKERAMCRLCLAVFDSPGRERVRDCPECGARTDRKGPTPLG